MQPSYSTATKQTCRGRKNRFFLFFNTAAAHRRRFSNRRRSLGAKCSGARQITENYTTEEWFKSSKVKFRAVAKS
jgi:hypothetical protein